MAARDFDTDSVTLAQVGGVGDYIGVWTMPKGVAFFEVKGRLTAQPVLMAFKDGRIAAGKYWTIPAGSSHWTNPRVKFPEGQTVYFSSTVVNTVEVMYGVE